MKKLFKLTAGLALSVALFSSCLKGGNTASYSEMYGTYVTRGYYGENAIPLVRLDDGSYIYHSSLRTMSSSLKSGDRLVCSFTLDFDNQSDEAYRNKYYDASDLSVTQFQTLYAEQYPTENPDQVKNDPIEGFETAFLTHIPTEVEIPEGHLITLKGLVKGDTKEHSYKLYFDKFAQKKAEDRYDTLKFIFSHDNNGEAQSVNTKRFLYSFNISPFSSQINESGKTTMIYIAYKTSTSATSSLKWLYSKP